MRTSRILATAAVIAIVAIASLRLHATTSSTPLAAQLGSTPVVVELFTSQGCSSCPPADALIHDLAHDPALRGKVIPLAFHVDYWNHLGWRDPFSAADWSRRQMFYVRALRVESAYTPQAVVNGSRQFVGSSDSSLRAALLEASARKAGGSVKLNLRREGNSLVAAVQAEVPADGHDHEVDVVVFEDDVTTTIAHGENAGRTLTNDAIVRRFVRAAIAPSGLIAKTVTIPIDSSWKQLGAAAFIQDRDTLAIGAATSARP